MTFLVQKNMSKKETSCSFCGRNRNEVNMLIAGISGHICENCVTQAHSIVKEEVTLTFLLISLEEFVQIRQIQ